jgi:3-oxoacyl-ACP reductase-like protein
MVRTGRLRIDDGTSGRGASAAIKLLDFALALAGGRAQEVLLVGRIEVRREKASRGQGELAGAHSFEERGAPPRRAGHFDAVVGAAVGQPQGAGAVREHRVVPGAAIQAARIELGQVDEQRRGRLALAAREAPQLGGESIIGEAGRSVHVHDF